VQRLPYRFWSYFCIGGRSFSMDLVTFFGL
jgi:hypothetical protein